MEIIRLQEIINGQTDAQLVALAFQTQDLEVLNTLASHSNHLVVKSCSQNPIANQSTITVINQNYRLDNTLKEKYINHIKNLLQNNRRTTLLSTLNKRIVALTKNQD